MTEGAIGIRPARSADLANLLGWTGSGADAPAWLADFWPSLTEGRAGLPHRLGMVATSGGDLPVGVLVASRLLEQTELEWIAVKPGYRRRGVARELLHLWLEWARRGGAKAALLEVRSRNAAARELYNSFGFTASGRRAGYYRDPPDDAVLLHLGLNADGSSP